MCGDCRVCEDAAQGCVKGVQWICAEVLCCGILCRALSCVRNQIIVPCCLLTQKACQPCAKCVTASCFCIESLVYCECDACPCSSSGGSYGSGDTTRSYNVARSYFDKDALESDKVWQKEQEAKKKRKQKSRDG